MNQDWITRNITNDIFAPSQGSTPTSAGANLLKQLEVHSSFRFSHKMNRVGVEKHLLQHGNCSDVYFVLNLLRNRPTTLRQKSIHSETQIALTIF